MATLINYLKNVTMHYNTILMSSSSIPPHQISLILGNPSADMDSIISSLCFAFLITKIYKNNQKIVLPVINCLQQDFKLRLEVVAILKKFLHIESIEELEKLFLFIDSDLIKYHMTLLLHDDDAFTTDITLIDHNELSLTDELYSNQYHILNSNIKCIIDHHELRTSHIKKIKENKIHIDSSNDGYKNWNYNMENHFYWIPGPHIGSCATLITLLWHHALDSIKILSIEDFPIEIRQLLLTTIIKDTSNLHPDLLNKRWDRIDQESIEWIKKYSLSSSSSNLLNNNDINNEHFLIKDTQQLYEEILAVRSNISLHIDFGWYTVLRMDNKTYQYDNNLRITYSSISVSLPKLIKQCMEAKHDVWKELNTFTLEKHAHILIIMSLSTHNNIFHRYMGIFFPSSKDINEKKKNQEEEEMKKNNKILTFVMNYQPEIVQYINEIQFLQLEPISLYHPIEGLNVFRQNNIHGARKKVEPLIQSQLTQCIGNYTSDIHTNN